MAQLLDTEGRWGKVGTGPRGGDSLSLLSRVRGAWGRGRPHSVNLGTVQMGNVMLSVFYHNKKMGGGTKPKNKTVCMSGSRGTVRWLTSLPAAPWAAG